MDQTTKISKLNFSKGENFVPFPVEFEKDNDDKTFRLDNEMFVACPVDSNYQDKTWSVNGKPCIFLRVSEEGIASMLIDPLNWSGSIEEGIFLSKLFSHFGIKE